MKVALKEWVLKWIDLYTEHLKSRVKDSVSELYSFMDKADVVLDKRVKRHEEKEDEEGEEVEGAAAEKEEGEEEEVVDEGPSDEELKAALYD
eukprot:7706679-Pyramimonas_sp.AAC.1